MVAVWRMYSTVIPHDSTRDLIASAVRFFIYIVRWQPWNGFQGYWNARRLLEQPQEKNKKTSDFGLTLNYRFGKVSILAETVYFLRKNSINLSTFAEKKVLTCLLFCGKDRQFGTFSQKRYKRYKRYTFESKDSSTPAFLVITPTFDHFTTYFSVFFSTFMANLNDKIQGVFRRGQYLYYTKCAHVPETQKCVTFVTFVTF